MKTVILCGGRGTRLNELGAAVPKALVPIGGKPVIWHLLNIFAAQGFNEFSLCLGYLGEKISGYFKDLGTDGGQDPVRVSCDDLNCVVSLCDTGLDTNTGGRVTAIESHLGNESQFFVTYGDGLADIDLRGLLEFHRSHGKIATLTAVHPISNFGILELGPNGTVSDFHEKPRMREWINGGFFVFNRQIFDYLEADSVLEREPLEQLAQEGQLMAYRHGGFWKCMDTYKDNIEMNELWKEHAPWKIW
jgi:glucose-1-phosphate cytidylyltransferase